eukprot:5939237-Pyramimonas_sp.AAC.1
MARSRSHRRGAPRILSSQTARDAGSELLRKLLELYASCKLTALDFSVICHLADVAGVPGANFALYGLAPGKQSGKYQDHLSKVLPVPSGMTMVRTPVNLHRRPRRTIRDVPVRCVFEGIEEEVSEDPHTFRILNAAPGDRDPC